MDENECVIVGGRVLAERDYLLELREAAIADMHLHLRPTWQEQEKVGERWLELLDEMKPIVMLRLIDAWLEKEATDARRR